MLFLLSPAKSLDYDTPPTTDEHTLPQFADRAAELIAIMRTKTPAEVASLMGISDALAALNVARYEAWRPKFTTANSKQAVLAFNGDVYGGLDARSLSPAGLEWAQRHLVILSGLYGALRPLDWMQPYRLEMGIRVANPLGADLYHYWAGVIAPYLNARLAGDASPVIVNLASHEYFKAVDTAQLKARVVQCVFEDYKGGKYKIISFHAKRARGLMARWAIEHQAMTPATLKQFDCEGYAHDAAASDTERLVFRRNIAQD